MNSIWAIVWLLAVSACGSGDTDHEQAKIIERDMRKAFEAAFSNRSDQMDEFFNQTFGPGVDQYEARERFKQAWESTSHGVRHFINETYTNISRIIQGKNDTVENEEASVPKRAISGPAVIKHDTPTPNKNKDGSLDSVWNFFRNIFGTNGGSNTTSVPTKSHSATPDATKVRSGISSKKSRHFNQTKDSEGFGQKIWNDIKGIFEGNQSSQSVPETPVAAAAASLSSQSQTSWGLNIGMLAVLSVVFVLFQITLNRNSLLNKGAIMRGPPHPNPVHSGYVRIA